MASQTHDLVPHIKRAGFSDRPMSKDKVGVPNQSTGMCDIPFSSLQYGTAVPMVLAPGMSFACDSCVYGGNKIATRSQVSRCRFRKVCPGLSHIHPHTCPLSSGTTNKIYKTVYKSSSASIASDQLSLPSIEFRRHPQRRGHTQVCKSMECGARQARGCHRGAPGQCYDRVGLCVNESRESPIPCFNPWGKAHYGVVP